MERPILIEDVEEVIELDVQRSKHSMPHVSEEALLNVLKTFAFFNREIEYCQGMNYIAGFLLALVQDEETAFRILQQVASQFAMHELFNPDIPRLKLYFLQMDRMLAQVNQDLAAHFVQENVSSSFFASAWFITLFTNSLKQNTSHEGQVNETLLQLWDYFIVSGWKAVLKLGLYLVTRDAAQLSELSFEGIL